MKGDAPSPGRRPSIYHPPYQRHSCISPYLSRHTKLVAQELKEWLLLHTYSAALRICRLSEDVCLSWLRKQVEADMYLLAPRVDHGLWSGRGRDYGRKQKIPEILGELLHQTRQVSKN